MRKIKLTKQEKAIEQSLLRGEYLDIGTNEFKQIAESLHIKNTWLKEAKKRLKYYKLGKLRTVSLEKNIRL